jgi:hypothetical protein
MFMHGGYTDRTSLSGNYVIIHIEKNVSVFADLPRAVLSLFYLIFNCFFYQQPWSLVQGDFKFLSFNNAKHLKAKFLLSNAKLSNSF